MRTKIGFASTASSAVSPTPPPVGSVTAGSDKIVPKPKEPGGRGEMNFSLRRLESPLELQQVAIDPTWNKFKTVMVFIGGISVFIIFGTLMFRLGGSGQINPSVTLNPPQVIERVIERPASAPAVQPIQTKQQAPRWPSHDECERHYALTLHEASAGRCN